MRTASPSASSGGSPWLRGALPQEASAARREVDIDVIGHRKETAKISQLFKELGYTPRERFNAFQVTRLIFNDLRTRRRVDVFLDVFEMCHKFDFKKRIDLENGRRSHLRTCPLDQASDCGDQREGHEGRHGNTARPRPRTEDSQDKINGSYIARLCAEDWGIYKTFTTNLAKIPEFANEGRPRRGTEEESIRSKRRT